MTPADERRSEPVQVGPPAELRRAPKGAITPTAWFREHQRRPGNDGGCWYFASVPPDPAMESGRFDLPAPEGTCYFGATPATAAFERVGRFTAKHRPVPADFLVGRVVTEIDGRLLPRHAINLASRRAAVLGVTGELFTMSDYTIPQQWAHAIRQLGHDALKYTPRFTPGGHAVAYFGQAGPRPAPVVGHTSLRQILQQTGVRIAELPASASLTMADPDDQ
ncbi:RES family NAD+ phosphorylase [Flexivirga sp.]|uniref:RES family NAD+ phosphorylase n=1 Tax=Flexivirga sp. TaxID=1962927 RepID=UPI003F806DDB